MGRWDVFQAQKLLYKSFTKLCTAIPRHMVGLWHLVQDVGIVYSNADGKPEYLLPGLVWFVRNKIPTKPREKATNKQINSIQPSLSSGRQEMTLEVYAEGKQNQYLLPSASMIFKNSVLCIWNHLQLFACLLLEISSSVLVSGAKTSAAFTSAHSIIKTWCYTPRACLWQTLKCWEPLVWIPSDCN